MRPPALRIPERILVRAQPEGAHALPWRAGSWVRVALRLAPVRGRTNPGGGDPARTLGRRGIGALAREVDPLLRAEIGAPAASGGLDALARVRRRGAERLAREGPGGGLLAALGLGEAGALGASARRDLARVGLSHLVAVSGLHLWLVAGPVYLACAALLRRSAWLAARGDTRRGGVALALVASAAYAVFTGLAAPVQRALVFLLLLALAQLARRRLVARGGVRSGGARRRRGRPGGALRARRPALLRRDRRARVERAGTGARGPRPRGRCASGAGRGAARVGERHGGDRAARRDALRLGLAARLARERHRGPAHLVRVPAAGARGGWRRGRAPGGRQPARWRSASRARRSSGTSRSPRWRGSRRRRRPGRAWRPERSASRCRQAWRVACIRARRTWLRLALALLAATRAGARPARRAPAAAPPRVGVPRRRAGRRRARAGARGASVLVDGGVAVPERFDAGERVVVPALGALGVSRLDLVVASHADLDHAGGLPGRAARGSGAAALAPAGRPRRTPPSAHWSRLRGRAASRSRSAPRRIRRCRSASCGSRRSGRRGASPRSRATTPRSCCASSRASAPSCCRGTSSRRASARCSTPAPCCAPTCSSSGTTGAAPRRARRSCAPCRPRSPSCRRRSTAASACRIARWWSGSPRRASRGAGPGATARCS